MSHRIVPCPQCGAPSEYSPTNAYRPFCSPRCRTQDLAGWAEERYRITGSETAVDSLSDDTLPSY